jgi:hypothetical protein
MLGCLVSNIGGLQARPEDESTMAHRESLTEILRVTSSRYVYFDCFSLTSALCRATANAFVEGTVVTRLEFRFFCSRMCCYDDEWSS